MCLEFGQQSLRFENTFMTQHHKRCACTGCINCHDLKTSNYLRPRTVERQSKGFQSGADSPFRMKASFSMFWTHLDSSLRQVRRSWPCIWLPKYEDGAASPPSIAFREGHEESPSHHSPKRRVDMCPKYQSWCLQLHPGACLQEST